VKQHEQQPNFLFFVTDQHRADFLGCYGHKVLRTPHIDSLASRGTRFDRFYVANPQCMPNRATLMTGRMPSVHGVRTNGIPLPLNANTFVDLLRANGYRTGLVGKCHLQTMIERPADRIPEAHASRRRGPLADFAEAVKPVMGDDYDQELTSKLRMYGRPRLQRRYYGFEHMDLCTMHGDMVGGDYEHWLRSRVTAYRDLRGMAGQLPHEYTCPQAWRTAVPEELYPTKFIEQKAVEYLTSHETRRGARPFFLMVSFPDPHHPFTPPGRYWDMYRPEDMVVPPSFDSGGDATPHVQQVRAQARSDKGNEYHAMAVSRREAQEAMALTCGTVAMIDDAIGAVLTALESSGLSDRTIVIFTSDHGDLMGDHGLLLKGPFHYRGLVRVPFIWFDRASQQRAVNCGGLSGTIDIAPTILARAGTEPYHGMQGRSLLPLMDGTAKAWRRGLVIEEEQHAGVLGYDEPLRARSYITPRYRLTMYLGAAWGELYDLDDDPHEQNNLWNSHYAQMALTDPSPLPTRLG